MLNSVLWLLCSALLQPSLQEMTLEELVAAQENARGLIRHIDLDLKFEVQNYIHGKPHGGVDRQPPWRWSYADGVERVRYRFDEALREDGRPQHIYDWLVDADSIKMLRNWDPQKPQAITPLDQGTVSAQVLARTRNVPGRDVTRQLLWTFSAPDGDDERRTLRELIQESTQTQLVGQTEVDGHRVWQLHIVHPGSRGKPRPGCYFDVFIEPETNFNIRRVVEHQDGMEQLIAGELEKFGLDVIRTVKQFRNFGDGVFVPIDIEMRIEAETSDKRVSISKLQVPRLVVNEPLPPDAMDFRFPEHVQVVYGGGSDPQTQRVELWGPHNQAIKEIRSPKDLPGYAEANERYPRKEGVDPLQSRQRSGEWMLWGNLTLVAIVVVFLLARGLRRRRGELP